MKTPHYQTRVRRLRQRLAQGNQPRAMLVTNQTNVAYLTGFSGSSGFLLVTPKRVILFSDTRYESQIAEECPHLEAEIRDAKLTTLQLVARSVRRLGIRELGIEASSVTLADYDGLRNDLQTTELAPLPPLVESLRAVKDAVEIAWIEQSIAVNERAFSVIRAQLRGDQTEREIAYNLEHQMRAFGATHCAFPPIVGVGARAALPHARASEQRIDEGSFVLIDWGAVVQCYCSDLTRVVITGKPPSKLPRVYEVVRAAHQAAMDAIRPGVEVHQVDRAARSVIERAGLGRRFGHGLGHGIGLHIHELPWFGPNRAGVLEENMVVTVEPGVYLPGLLGVRIEDDVLVTADGCRRLSTLPTDLEACFVRV